MTDLVRLSHGLYRPPGSVAELADLCAAFLDVFPADTVVGGITAARLHGLWLPEPRPDEKIELIITRAPARPCELPGSRRDEVRARRRTLRGDEITEVGGLPVVAEPRSWIELSETLCIEDVVAAGDCVLRGATRLDELTEIVHRARRRRGVLRAREALTLLDARSRSRPESWTRCKLVRGGLPVPEVNVAIHDRHGQWLAEPDLVYKRAKLAIEYNGADHADKGRMRADITREIDVDADGWHVAVLGPAQVFSAQPRAVTYVRLLLDRYDPGWRGRPLG